MDALLRDAPAALASVEDAPAKINLALHVVGRRPDGYHTLDSLVVFAATGDRIEAAPASRDAFAACGAFGDAVPAGEDNIVVRALGLARRIGAVPPLHVTLRKQLPPASGIGGGSADAAALLRLVSRGWSAERRAALHEASLALGADVPMCLLGAAARIGGIGERIEPLAALPTLGIVLANPGVEIATPAAFAALARRDNAPMDPLPDGGFASFQSLLAYLERQRNDLEAPARQLAPPVDAALAALRAAGAPFARMSGSGATVFALAPGEPEAARIAGAVARAHPGWWVRATPCRPAGRLAA